MHENAEIAFQVSFEMCRALFLHLVHVSYACSLDTEVDSLSFESNYYYIRTVNF